MLKIIYITLFTVISIVGYSQIPLKVDYTTDVFLQCDSVVLYEYGSIDQNEWESLFINKDIADNLATDKQVLYYRDGVLSLEKNYSLQADKWVYNSKVTYEITGKNVIETTTAFFGSSEFSVTESYNLDYVWVTKLRPIDVLPMDEASSVLTDPKIKAKYDKEIKNIVDGSVTTSEVDAHEKVKAYKNVNGQIIREERIVLTDSVIVMKAINHLKRETTNEFSYSPSGDILSKKGSSYKYIYDNEGSWIWMNRSGYLIERTIY